MQYCGRIVSEIVASESSLYDNSPKLVVVIIQLFKIHCYTATPVGSSISMMRSRL